jgi:hypothetical protein
MRITLLFALAAVLAGCESVSPQNAPKTATEVKPAVAPAAPKPAAVAAAVPVTPVTDAVTIGDDVSETAHGHKGQSDETGEWSDRTYRHSQGGWFSWDFKVIPGQPALLTCSYWGSDQRTFDILIDGKKLLTENNNNDHPETFFDKSYTIPAAMTQGKQKVTVKFQAPDAEGYAGGVFGAKMTSPAPATRPSGQ